MRKKIGIILGVIVAVLLVLLGLLWVSTWQNNQEHEDLASDDSLGSYELEDIKKAYAKIDYSGYDLTDVVAANEDTGNLPENVIGDKDAPVKIIEYADYQCSYCALMNPYLKKIVEKNDGKVAFVVRPYILSYHPNGVAAASAAIAAAKQGIWEEYKDLLFLKQDDWFYSNAEKRQQQFETYFKQVAGDKGDLAKFRADMKSEEVAQKVAFDMGAAVQDEVGGTPYFYLDGEWIENEGVPPADYAEVLSKKAAEKLNQLKK